MTGDPEYTLLYYPHNLRELQELGAGDPRWSGSTALHGSIISNQPSIVQYLVDHGANIDAKTETGWTPLDDDARRVPREHGPAIPGGRGDLAEGARGT